MKTIKNYKSLKALLSVFGLIAMTLSFNSCEQFDIDEDPLASQVIVGQYGSIAQLELGVTGIFGRLNKAAWMSTFYVNGWSGDDLTTHVASNKADFREYDQRNVTAENSRTLTNWVGIYEMIRAANIALESIEGVQFEEADKQEQLVGETHFLRAIMFMHLARIHGRIPLVLTLGAFQQPGLNTQLEVFEQIESDLLAAESMLPASTNVGSSRPSSGTARAFLARLYMDWAGFPLKDTSKYALAASSAKQVIDNAATHGFALESDLAKLWSLAGRFNAEGVFTIVYKTGNPNLSNRKMGKLGLPSDAGLNGWQETFAEIRYFEDMPDGARKEATYYDVLPRNDAGAIDTDNPTQMTRWEEFTDQQNPIFRKIVGDLADGDWAQFQTQRSDLYMRYAEVLLIYAEASAEAGSAGADAWEALNMVRRRAAGLDYMTAYGSAVPQRVKDPADESQWIDHPTLTYQDISSGDLADMAFTERKWELAGEFIRWNDLVRKEKVAEALGGTARDPLVSIGTAYDANGNGTPQAFTGPQNPISGPLTTDNYFAPIPQEEVDKNPNLID